MRGNNDLEGNEMRMSKWFAAILLLLAISPSLAGLLFSIVINPIVSAEIRNHPNGKDAREAMLLTFDDRTLVVNYLKEGSTVFVGVDGKWWRAFAGNGIPVSMLIRGETYHGRGELAPDDPAFIEDVFSRLRPTTPDWLPSVLTAKLIVITLDSMPAPS